MERVIQAIKAAKVFAAKKDIRYYFNGVALFIRNGKIISVVATNGHSMCVIGNRELKPEECVIVGNENITTLVNSLLTSDTVSVNDDVLTVGQYTLPLVDGRYPDIKRVLPAPNRKCDVSSGIGVNPVLLADLEKSRKELIRHLPPKDRNFIGVVMKFGSANDVISFEYTSEKVDPCIVCISPMRL